MIWGWGEGLTHSHWKQCRHELYIIDNAEFYFIFFLVFVKDNVEFNLKTHTREREKNGLE